MGKKPKIKDEPLDVPGAFRTAEVNLKSANLLGNLGDTTGDGDYIFPYAILNALATELYYKCIFAIENRDKSIEGHDLKRLFDRLSQPSQGSIREDYKRLLGKRWVERSCKALKKAGAPKSMMKFAFDDVLNDARLVFVCWRYPFVRERMHGGMRAPFPLVHSARRRVIELQPALEQRALVQFEPDQD